MRCWKLSSAAGSLLAAVSLVAVVPLLTACGPRYGGVPADGSSLDIPPPAATPEDEPTDMPAVVEPQPAAPQPVTPMPSQEAARFLGLRTAAYHVEDLERAKAWYAAVLGTEPYFDEPFYVGFNVGGYELGLVPVERGQASDAGRVVVYWGVPDADAALAHLLEQGAKPNEAVQDVGDGVRVATVRDPFGNVFGIIENPYFSLPSDDE